MRGEFLLTDFARGCAAAVECILAEVWDARKSSIEFGSGGGETRGEVLLSVWVASDARLDVLVRRGGRGSDGGVANCECNHVRNRVIMSVIMAGNDPPPRSTGCEKHPGNPGRCGKHPGRCECEGG